MVSEESLPDDRNACVGMESSTHVTCADGLDSCRILVLFLLFPSCVTLQELRNLSELNLLPLLSEGDNVNHFTGF